MRRARIQQVPWLRTRSLQTNDFAADLYQPLRQRDFSFPVTRDATWARAKSDLNRA